MNKDYFKNKRAALSWGKQGAMMLHVHKDWTMKQITRHVDGEWMASWNKKAIGIEIHELGKVGEPLRGFMRDEKGKWKEVELKAWSKDAVQGYHDFLERAVRDS